MPETRHDLEQELLIYQRDRNTNEEAIRETLKLLEKADQRLRDNPAEKSKWGRTLDNLEYTLSEKQRLLASSQTNIQQIERRLEDGKFADEDGNNSDIVDNSMDDPVDETVPLTLPENLTLNDLKAAVKRIISTHIIRVHSISEIDFRLAKAFMSSRAGESLSSNDTVELRKRLSILEKSRGGVHRKAVIEAVPIADSAATESSRTEPDMLNKNTVQTVLQKCADDDLGSITLEEMDMLAKYGRALALLDDEPKKDLLPLITESLASIRERFSIMPLE